MRRLYDAVTCSKNVTRFYRTRFNIISFTSMAEARPNLFIKVTNTGQNHVQDSYTKLYPNRNVNVQNIDYKYIYDRK